MQCLTLSRLKTVKVCRPYSFFFNFVLGPWLWPRPILPLASRGSVFGFSWFLVLGPWFWPRIFWPRIFFSVLGLEYCVLDSRSASNIEHVTCNLNEMIDDHDNENNLN